MTTKRDLTDDVIDQARKETFIPDALPRVSEHNDCVRICYEWLDAQNITKACNSCVGKAEPELWGGRYVGEIDMRIAIHLHSKIRGKYPRVNISKRLIKPSRFRLSGIGEACKHRRFDESNTYSWYSRDETGYPHISFM